MTLVKATSVAWKGRWGQKYWYANRQSCGSINSLTLGVGSKRMEKDLWRSGPKRNNKDKQELAR